MAFLTLGDWLAFGCINRGDGVMSLSSSSRLPRLVLLEVAEFPQDKKCERPYDLDSELTWCHLHCVLSARASQEGSLDSRTGKIYCPSMAVAEKSHSQWFRYRQI